ncbi:MAG: M24 family metallopeptidase [Candidatus Nanohalobium sp.]
MIERIREEMSEEGLELFVISDSDNILWATGEEFSGYIFLTQDRVDAVLPRFFRYEDVSMFDSVSYGFKRSDYKEVIDDMVERFSGMDTAIDEENDTIEDELDAEVSGMVTEMRKVKTEEEVGKIRKACEITDRALKDLRQELFSGLTEWEAVGRLKQFYIGEEVQESFITNEGESLVQRNSLRPHRGPESEVVEGDDLVIVDTGARFENYCADVTRTYCDNASDRQQKVFDDVKEVQRRMIDMIEPGRSIADVKQRELDIFEEKGYEVEKNVLYYSHGIGIVAHEPPTITHESEEEFKEGMVVTIEPGLHIEGLGGVRIEDTVLVTEEGSERLSKAPIEL